MSQIIPYWFDPPSIGDATDENLEIEVLPSGKQVTWRLIGTSVFIPDDNDYDSLAAAAKANGGRFTVHGDVGFSLDTYHEFFISELPVCPAGFNMGGVEATYGDASPLAAFLFEPRRSKWNGEWEEISSLRIFGAAHDDAELAYLNASARYFELTGYWPVSARIGDNDWLDEPEEKKDTSAIVFGAAMSSRIEPLRFLAAGARQSDDLAACVYYYRVIEYFSFFVHERDILRLRHDATLSDAQFSRKILDLITRDERGPIMRLVQKLVDQPLLDNGKSAGLIEKASAQIYAEKLYEFRNSIVHGKFSYGFTLASPPSFGNDESVARWRKHLLVLARRALAASV